MNIPIGTILVKNSVLTGEQLASAAKLSKDSNIKIEDAIKQLDYATSKDIAKCLAEHFNTEFLDIDEATISDINLDLVPIKTARKHGIVPISKNGNILTVAMCTQPDFLALENLRFALGIDVKCVLVTPESFENVFDLYKANKKSESSLPSVDNILGHHGDIDDDAVEIEVVEGEFSQETTEDDAPIIRIVMYILSNAVKSKASDIHIEPFTDKLRIRYRIDGVCHVVNELPKKMQGAIISRLKIMANIDITEKRKPQDGRISLTIAGKPLDLRVSTIPVTNGESIVMRLLESESIMVSLDELGFSDNDLTRFQSAIRRPNGIILVTGPTGSGKTTTLYSSLNELNTSDKKIITVENPIEYDLKGVNQCEVNEIYGLTFPVILRSILRQDPNIVVIGEIRDLETAEIAIAAALTGHLILSTLHTNDAPSAITRLTDMGAKSYLIASSILAVMAQRLVRVICKKCKEPFQYSQKQLLEAGFNPDESKDVIFYKGKGCKHCEGSGYKGRMGIYELMIVNNEIRELIYKKETKQKIKDAASNFGMRTLREDGIKKVFNGMTTIEEVNRVAE
ncbi:MAG: GspE/PulE family protein [Candidatus Anammoxibacter sp.]